MFIMYVNIRHILFIYIHLIKKFKVPGTFHWLSCAVYSLNSQTFT